MATFKKRTTAPTESDNIYYRDNPYYQIGYGLPNCTCYAFGRFWEITGEYPSLADNSDASSWWGNTSDGYKRGQTPKLGAVMCWTEGGSGHVAIVEEVKSNGDVVYTESWYDRWDYFFNTATATKSSGYYFHGGDSSWYFQGFIYCGIEFDSTTGSGVTGANTSILNPTTRNATTTIQEKTIWKYLIYHLNNPYGVAGLMGNLYAESGLFSCRVQGDFSDGYSESIAYTSNIDKGNMGVNSFKSDTTGGGGYGLAQWTDPGRKENMYTYCVKKGSIGNLISQLEFLLQEMKSGYPSTYNTLLKATSVFEASTDVLVNFERPSGYNTSLKQNERSSIGESYYKKYKDITKAMVAEEEKKGTSEATDTTEEEEEEQTYKVTIKLIVVGDLDD